MTFFKQLLIRSGLFELEIQRVDGQQEPLTILAGETIRGGIETTRDVLVHGHVAGDIRTPLGRVIVAPQGRLTDGTTVAKELRWQGILGGCVVECGHVNIATGAQSRQDQPPPKIIYETMQIGKIGGLDASFTRKEYPAAGSVTEVAAQTYLKSTTQELSAG